MPPLEAWRKVLIDPEAFLGQVHGYVPCTECHGGSDVPEMEAAHEGMVTDPSNPENETCRKCHPDIGPMQEDSLHYNLVGYDTALYARSAPEHHETLEYMEEMHCNECHATCGQCHVSQPASVGGGLLEGHAFGTPPMGRTCTACHGSRVGNEYTGQNEGYIADVHVREARMSCVDCHQADEMHGKDIDVEARYEGPQVPSCESCHEDQIGVGSEIREHNEHSLQLLSCQVCHSTAYSNCWDCHVQLSEDEQPYYLLAESSLGFYIGRNPERTMERPYRYMPVRHVPIDPNSFEFYGEDLLPNFADRATWRYATPHNIQRNTPQTESCENCHENTALFLTSDKVVPEALQDHENWTEDELATLEALEMEANAAIIVDSPPPLPPDYEPEPTPMPEAEEEEEESVEELFE